LPVFISYSHSDRDFAEKLALQLVKERAPVWIDRWELNVGDSLIQRIQDAVAGASALLLVLSKACGSVFYHRASIGYAEM
jgi:hypothetical protein